MPFLAPTPPPYDPLEWLTLPFPERVRRVSRAWALQGYGAPIAVYLVYVVKIGLYVLGWALFCGVGSFAMSLGRLPEWWLEPIAFQKAIVWSLLFEILGLGCSSGPLSGRYVPPFGGALYFLRPGTTKLPLFPSAPIIGARTRGVLDVSLYLALLICAVRALVAPALELQHLLPLAILVPALGVLDKTAFLAARAEHYWVVLVCFTATTSWLPAAMVVQLALWFFAGFSKLNHHFPTVTCVMTSNGPLTRAAWIRKAMYRAYPDDLRPSRLATWMAHGGTALEIAVPIAFLVTPLGAKPIVGIALMLALHGYITSNVPMAVPLEWNVAVVYSGFALFWAHPGVSIQSIGPAWLAVFVVGMSVGLPLLGNLYPRWVSFLLAMRYYAGNWAYSIWLFRGDSYRKLGRLKTTSPWVYDQLARFYDRGTAVALVSKVVGFRMMHLHGRALVKLLPKAVDRVEDYEWMDGEIVAGMVLGWNFGEGHLHQEQLCESIQAQCGFEEGELRCIFVESQPLGRGTMEYRLHDAKTGYRNAASSRSPRCGSSSRGISRWDQPLTLPQGSPPSAGDRRSHAPRVIASRRLRRHALHAKDPSAAAPLPGGASPRRVVEATASQS
ncbi:MAG: DUF3556 domain-containing protein [Polyangiaceae bacterium]